MTESRPDSDSGDLEQRSYPALGESDVAWLLVGGGVVASLITLLRDRRGLADWALPVGLVGAGLAILLKRRQAHLDTAQENILAELDSLDPIARAQVLTAVAEQQLRWDR
jgi:hypothetical protein